MRSWLAPTAAGLFLGAIGCAWLLPVSESTGFFWLHLLLPLLAALLALPWVATELRAPRRDGWLRGALAAAGLCLLCGGAAWLPLPRLARDLAVWLHAAAGTAVGVLLLAHMALRTAARRKKAAGFGLAALLIAPLGVYGVSEAAKQRQTVSAAPPRYDAQACFRFLTATVADDSGAPLFPSALRFDQGPGAASTDCTRSGCHTSYVGDHPHSTTGTSLAYQKTLGDFLKRRGAEAARWCQGCHAPETLRQSSAITCGMEAETFTCLTCHGTREVHAAYGNAALALGAAPNLGQAGSPLPDAPWLRRKQHSESLFRPDLRNSSEFCGSCHRKNWNLPQNEYRWLPGPDEYRNWRESAYSGLTSYASGSAMVTKGCTDCHSPHASSNARKKPEQPPRRFMALDAFLRRDTPVAIAPVDRSLAPRPGEAVLLDVVVRNTGIGHDFPTGMPDLQEAWLEVRIADGKGAPALANGMPSSGSARDNQAHFYRLVALDRQGRAVQHGDLDRMVGVAEWRRIPAGESDLARYRLTVPKGGLGEISIQLLRRQRPAFARWAGEAPSSPEVLAETRLTPLGPTAPPLLNEGGDYLARRWREYGAALTRVQAYPQAIQALNRALAQTPADLETLLALGQVFWQEGDLLAAREQFRRAATAAPEDVRPLAWDARVERKMGQLESAARMLTPLIRRFPRDTKLRFELGLALMDQLQNEEAAREFEAILDVDPLNASAHYNLMRCRQRLNQLTVARREEVIYRLLNQEDAPPLAPAAGQPPFREDQLLHVHSLEPHL